MPTQKFGGAAVHLSGPNGVLWRALAPVPVRLPGTRGRGPEGGTHPGRRRSARVHGGKASDMVTERGELVTVS
ncbi:hypothetical protein Sliba_20510 [Streptomyces nigrescens]|uniref:Uncharacterized protein n=1 Tax=Streptomyces nigrescens TaxID=1920 RepID=A0A640TDZ4_STRNI|nr:hypothetical protein Sliba_20510 [Streptomyces libani subsp. libani]GGW06628.1 hypothetical protein GCM10010500_73560 [Streptomyces libani subsp. libani]